MATTVVWFRRDLRLSDQPAVAAAVRAAGPGGSVIGLFCLDPHLWTPSGANRRAFLLGCIDALDRSMDGHLLRRIGDPVEVVPDVAEMVGAEEVFITADFGPYGAARDVRVESALAAAGRRLVREGTAYAVAPGAIRTTSGTPYKVFTPYSRAWRDHGWPAPTSRPRRIPWERGPRGAVLPSAVSVAALPAPGEEAARRVARTFWDRYLPTYDSGRDVPGTEATSRLSPYLKFGCLHPRQLLSRLGRSEADRVFRSELCWREFYADVLHHRPDTARTSFNPSMAVMVVDEGLGADRAFEAWSTGHTGYPIIDAGMRQLLAEGWMHNRVRMLVASFLVKDLHLDWTVGARWFMRHLVDGDLPSNQHGWQWVAGTGTDAAPYVRIFNPVLQGERFDPGGIYVRRWVPELAEVPDRHVHHPWTDPAGPPRGYPSPMVDHAEEREEALRRYAAVRGTSG